jgi:hypothetical protein
MSTWILQANPKMYNIDEALKDEVVIYWRIPQYTNDVNAGDRVLIWRSGKQAGFIGWGVALTPPQRYDMSGKPPSTHWEGGHTDAIGEFLAPIRVWPASEVRKTVVAAVIPKHQIVRAPMGTVFRLDDSDLEAILPNLTAAGYELGRGPDIDFTAAPVLSDLEPEPTPSATVKGAKVTPALFLLSSTPEYPTEITIEGDALRLALVEREAVKVLDESWDAVGVYLLIGPPPATDSSLSVYVGKAQGLRSRVKGGHQEKSAWTRCLLVHRHGLHPFNASDISWLERRLIDVLLEAPEVDLINKTPPPVEFVPEYKAEILERTVVAILGVLGVLGAYTV